MELILNASQQLVNNFAQIASNNLERQLSAQLSAIEAQKEAELENFQGTEAEKNQIESKFATERAKIEKQAAKQEKNLAIAQVAIQGAIAIAKAYANSPATLGLPQSAILAGLTAAQIAVVKSQQFEDGGVLKGPSHSEGGIPFTVDGRPGFEAEGDEVIINKRSAKMFPNELNAINIAGGGKPLKFQGGGVIPSVQSVTQLSREAQSDNTERIINGLRGVISEEVGSIEVTNNAVDTANVANNVANIENDSTFG